MTRTLQLEDFGDTSRAPPVPSQANSAAIETQLPEAELEGGNLDAFEQGYRSGWDDCTANEQEERRRVGADLEAALAEISIEREAVRQELLFALRPLFEQIASQLLPAVAAEAVAPMVVDELIDLAADRTITNLELSAAPATCQVLENLVLQLPDLDVSIIPEPALADGQVSLRLAGQRREIDLSDAAMRTAEAIRDFAATMVSGREAGIAPVGSETGPSETSSERGVA